jgi:pyruvate dehydrogenase E2 component (dihydrolipoamide acetyltransferase)
MLALSPTMEEGHLVTWTKQVGEEVSEGDVIAEIETDKATMEMESFFEGTLLEQLVPEGSNVPINAPIAIIGEEGEDISAIKAELDGGAPAEADDAGDDADADAGDADAGDADAGDDADADEDTKADADQAPAQGDGQRIFASPVARKMVKEHGLDLASIQGSGPRGRIVKRDVEEAIVAAEAAPAKAAAEAPAKADAKAGAKAGASISVDDTPPPMLEGSQRVELTPMRKTIARRMSSSWVSAPMFTLNTEVDMDAAVKLRASLNEALAQAEAGYKVSYNDLVIKACAVALNNVPGMNVAWGGDHIVQHQEVHIGMAVALDGGLITPVIRHADKLGLGAISQAARELAGKARDKKLKPEDYQGSTFSVSNLGMFGVTRFQAVINPPEAGILAVGALVKKPVVGKNGELTVGHRMDITLSCDHRSTDGAQGALYLAEVRRLLEHPVLLTV